MKPTLYRSSGQCWEKSRQLWQILLVEDDPLMQLGLEQFFANYDQYKVVGQAANGYQAVEMSLALQPDLVIMDIGLPQMDGIEATKQIKSSFPNIHVVMLTSHRSQTETVAALASGADVYCLKGISFQGLLTAISAAREGAVYLDSNVARHVVDRLQLVKPHREHRLIGKLSTRELEVLKLIVDGKTNPEIAEILYLSLSTVKTNVR